MEKKKGKKRGRPQGAYDRCKRVQRKKKRTEEKEALLRPYFFDKKKGRKGIGE